MGEPIKRILYPSCTQAGDPMRDRERQHGQRVTEALANLRGGYTPCHLGEGKGRILKWEIPEDFNGLPIPWPLLAGEVPALLSLSTSTINLC
jgi:hypothetical protein